MDTSETYIKMCEKATEIQALRIVANGDFELRFKHNRGQVEVHHHREITAHYRPEDHIWLPRQDQLQEMIEDQPNLLLNFGYFAFAVDGNRYLHCKNHGVTSMEQLCLAFVMKEKYNKVWNGTDWI